MLTSEEQTVEKEPFIMEKKSELSRIWGALLHSLSGLKAVFRSEAAFRLECYFALVMIPVAMLMSVTVGERLLLIGSLFLVLIIELLNSAIEDCVNYISRERHPLAKKIKDIGSAAVFLSILNAFTVWGVILFSVLGN